MTMQQTAVADVSQQEVLFTDIVNMYVDDLYTYARYMVSDTDDADDIVQKTFLSFYNNMHKLKLAETIKPWLFTVARNHCLDFLKKKKNVAFSDIDEGELEIPSTDVSIEQQIDSEGFQDNVKQHMLSLPSAFREVMLLKYFEDLTFEEIAERTLISINTVKSNFYRGKRLLYKALKAQVGPGRDL